MRRFSGRLADLHCAPRKPLLCCAALHLQAGGLWGRDQQAIDGVLTLLSLTTAFSRGWRYVDHFARRKLPRQSISHAHYPSLRNHQSRSSPAFHNIQVKGERVLPVGTSRTCLPINIGSSDTSPRLAAGAPGLFNRAIAYITKVGPHF